MNISNSTTMQQNTTQKQTCNNNTSNKVQPSMSPTDINHDTMQQNMTSTQYCTTNNTSNNISMSPMDISHSTTAQPLGVTQIPYNSQTNIGFATAQQPTQQLRGTPYNMPFATTQQIQPKQLQSPAALSQTYNPPFLYVANQLIQAEESYRPMQ